MPQGGNIWLPGPVPDSLLIACPAVCDGCGGFCCRSAEISFKRTSEEGLRSCQGSRCGYVCVKWASKASSVRSNLREASSAIAFAGPGI